MPRRFNVVKWDNGNGVLIEVEDRYDAFLSDYRQICARHGLQVFSEGEEIEIGPLDKSGKSFRWLIEATARMYNERREWERKCAGSQ